MNTVQRRQTKVALGQGLLSLLALERIAGAVRSPYFQTTDLRKEASRNIHLFLETMNLKALITGYSISGAQPSISVFFESDDSSIEAGTILPVSIAYGDSDMAIQAKVATVVNNFCSTSSLPVPTIDWLFTTPTDLAAAILAAAPVAPVASALSLSLQTSTGAVGTQVSTTRSSYVMLNGNVSTTASIGGNAAGDIILEVAPTNSATAGDWVEWGRIGNSQAITLALTLNSVQVTKGMAVAFVQAGYYVKARTAGSGTVSYTLTNAKQILI